MGRMVVHLAHRQALEHILELHPAPRCQVRIILMRVIRVRHHHHRRRRRHIRKRIHPCIQAQPLLLTTWATLQTILECVLGRNRQLYI